MMKGTLNNKRITTNNFSVRAFCYWSRSAVQPRTNWQILSSSDHKNHNKKSRSQKMSLTMRVGTPEQSPPENNWPLDVSIGARTAAAATQKPSPRKNHHLERVTSRTHVLRLNKVQGRAMARKSSKAMSGRAKIPSSKIISARAGGGGEEKKNSHDFLISSCSCLPFVGRSPSLLFPVPLV